MAKKVIAKEIKCDMDDCFLKTIAHPNKKILAAGLLKGDNPESFYESYGNIRVMEMQNLIAKYRQDPEKYIKGRLSAGCKTCGR